ncbi:ubiquitin-40S ribosomal protein S27a [Mucor velutinosus]|uniref:Ubiquitin-40S ribosomal protein S27a n=1 Tax=Mucor velutinosus TaxID=708070 RepID=A0AAN7I0R1_9FUNG|nr:ubiquitin-40S ribosomal protein S27a [Mucor velutinosus]
MTRRKSVQELVKPLRKLSLLPSANNHSFQPDLEFVPEQIDLSSPPYEHEQADIISLLPREVIFKIFSLLTFQDLITVQLTCRLWKRLTQDTSIWRSRLSQLNSRFVDIYAHQPAKSVEATALPLKTRYCQAITFANWRMGTVQNATKLDDNDGHRLLSVKLRDGLLITLAEDNMVRLYQYTTEAGFTHKTTWSFGDPTQQPSNMVECIDILPDINILVVAQRGSKCMFYDITKGPKHDPIQVLKGGSHPWFVPDSISVNQDYFAVSGRKPSAVFVWNWRKGVRLSNRAFDNQPHNVFLSGDNLITVSVDGLLHIFDIFDNTGEASSTHYLNPCSIPCIEYDNALSIILAPHASRRIHHYRWREATPPSPLPSSSDSEQSDDAPIPQPSASVPVIPRRRRLSTTFSNLLGLKSSTSSHHIPTSSSSTTLHHSANSSNQPRPSTSTSTLLKKSSREFYKSVRIRRHSSYNDYGYACQMKTDQYIKQHINSLAHKVTPPPLPKFDERPRLVHSIRTTPLGNSAKEIVNVAKHGDRVATVNRHGDISLYALNGTTAARVTYSLHEIQDWMEQPNDINRDDDDLSDGYDFVRSRLAMGSMGLVYGSKNGSLWWLDFGCRATVPT